MSGDTFAPSQAPGDIREILPISDVWGVTVHAATPGVACVFKGKKLHSFGIMGASLERTVVVSFAFWTQMRAMADRAKVACAVYVKTDRGLFFLSLPPMAGLDYAVVWDAVYGASIEIPKADFKPVAKREGAS